MHHTIKERLLAILAADPRLFAGGESYPSGWPGVQLAGTQGPKRGYVNLYGTRPNVGSIDSRPAIFLGTASFQFQDKLEYESCVAEGKIEYRVVMLPLLICAMNQNKGAVGEEDADAQVSQLENNVRQILFDPENIVSAGAWYNLTLAHDTDERGLGASSSGGGSADAAESTIILPIEIHYSYKVGSPA